MQMEIGKQESEFWDERTRNDRLNRFIWGREIVVEVQAEHVLIFLWIVTID